MTLLVDAYHQYLNVVPFDITSMGLGGSSSPAAGTAIVSWRRQRLSPRAARVPPSSGVDRLVQRVRRTERADRADRVEQMGAGAARFSGATYDPVSHYRAAAACVSRRARPDGRPPARHQPPAGRVSATNVRIAGPSIRPSRTSSQCLPTDAVASWRSGAPTPRTCHARCAIAALTDVRGDLLRLGPAPYISDLQLRHAIDALRGIPLPNPDS